jgi:acyl dehydratase
MDSDNTVHKTQQTPPHLYLDDITVGDTFRSKDYVIDEAAIKAFATQFDPQPFHLDDTTAKQTLFGGLAASGWHTAAITMRLMVTSGLPLADGIIGAGGEISWPKPTRPNDVLHVESTVVAVTPSRSKPDRGIVTVQSDTLNQDGDLVQRLVAKLMVTKKPA